MLGPTINAGTTFRRTSAAKWNELFRVVEANRDAVAKLQPVLSAITEGGFIPIRMRVALVESPTEGSPLMVRRVIYVNTPPVVGEYRWEGDAFKANPDIGFETMDFEPFLWASDNPGDPPPRPTLETSILTARLETEYWVVEMPEGGGGAERLVVVREFGGDPPNAGSDQLIVQEVRPEIEDGAHTGNYIVIGDPITVKVWPHMVAGHYSPFFWTAAEITRRTTILPATQIGGVWYVKQRTRMAVSKRRGPVKLLDCSPLEENSA